MAIKSKVAESALYKRCVEQIREQWPDFLKRRADYLAPLESFGFVAERATENILQDLFANVLDWDIRRQVSQHQRADLVLTRLGIIRHAIVEAKRPGALKGHPDALEKALGQARGYAADQKITRVVVSDAMVLVAEDIDHDARTRRVCVSLEDPIPPESLWWISFNGLHQEVEDPPSLSIAPNSLLEQATETQPSDSVGERLQSKYKLPSRCFAYVGDPTRPNSWKLPYLLLDGTVDKNRLPAAINAIVRNYRGVQVVIPDPKAVPYVVLRLAEGAHRIGKLPKRGGAAAKAYHALVEVMTQLASTPAVNPRTRKDLTEILVQLDVPIGQS